MASFPLLRTSAVAQYPSARSIEHSTGVSTFIDGREQRYRQLRTPVRRWMLRMWQVSEEELSEIESFFTTHQGQTGSFSFTDPWDGTAYPDCSFEDDEIALRLIAEGRSGAVITIRNNQV